ncbi:MAG: prepilin-type N-terminal cleavage/methylation domain-containing protein, partial [Clostridium sp.]
MKKKNNKGFSLIELIIAIAILVILTGLLAPQFMRYMEKSREAKDMQVLDTVYSGVQVALANEKAYDEVQTDAAKADGTLSALTTTAGMTLDAIIVDTNTTEFSKEVRATLGNKKIADLWSSKAAKDATVHAYVKLDKDTLAVTIWLASDATDVTAAKPLDTTTTP